MKAKIKKKRMGRPPKSPEDRRSTIITVRVTDFEHRRILAEAERSGVSVSELLLAQWRDKKER